MLIFRFWPVWVPLVLWLVWWLGWGRKKHAKGTLQPWEKKLWMWAVAASVALLTGSLLVLGLSQEETAAGTYVPAQYKDGQLIPAHIVHGEEQ